MTTPNDQNHVEDPIIVTDKGTPAAKPMNAKRRKLLTIIAAIFIVLATIWFFYWLIWSRFEVYTDDAYVTGNMVQLMSQVPGTVVAINADDTYFVQQGQQIVKLDPADTLIALQHAQSTLALTVRQVSQEFEKAQQAQASLVLSKADLVKAQLDLKRRDGLIGDRAISREEMQHFQTSVEAAQAQYDVAVHNARAAIALVANSHMYTHPEVALAKQSLKNAYLNFMRTSIVAPVTGYVARRNVQIGQQVGMNTPLLAIIPLNEVWVDANFKESQLSDLRIGQPVTLEADAYSGVTYHGKVVGLNAGTGSAFSLLPAQNATGNWIKIVQRLPVRISLDPDELKKYPLQIGLSMRVYVNIHHTDGERLSRTAANRPLYTTDVYQKQLADVDVMIDKILQDNSPDMFLPPTNLQ